jgi:hypothetical protein
VQRGRDADNAETKISEPLGKEREEMIILLRCLDAGRAGQTLRDILDGTSSRLELPLSNTERVSAVKFLLEGLSDPADILWREALSKELGLMEGDRTQHQNPSVSTKTLQDYFF